MKKTLLHIIFLLFTFNAISQIKYKPVFSYECENLGFGSEYFSIHSDKNSVLKDFNGFYLLEPKKKYNIYSYACFCEYEIDISKAKNDTLIDSLTVSKLQYFQPVGPGHYMYCDSIANGDLTGFHFNGSVKLKGRFKDGQIVDTAYYYSPKGVLTEMEIHTKKEFSNTTYYPNGQIKFFYDHYKHKYRKYYENGAIMIIGNDRIHKEYNIDGELIIKNIYKRKRKSKG